MKKLLNAFLVVLICGLMVGCQEKVELTKEEKDILQYNESSDMDYIQVMQDNGYILTIGYNELELTYESDSDTYIFKVAKKDDYYGFGFYYKNDSYVVGLDEADEKTELFKQLLNELQRVKIDSLLGLSNQALDYVEKYKDAKEALSRETLDAKYEIRTKLRDAGYTEVDYDDPYFWVTKGTSRGFTFSRYRFFEDSTDGSIIYTTYYYDWIENSGSGYHDTVYYYDTGEIVEGSSTAALTEQQKLECIVNMMYIRQEFNKELDRIGITIEQIQNYVDGINELNETWQYWKNFEKRIIS